MGRDDRTSRRALAFGWSERDVLLLLFPSATQAFSFWGRRWISKVACPACGHSYARCLCDLFLFLLLSLAYAALAMSLSSRQFGAIEVTERVASSFSILGTLFVISTYLASPDFHKPINRLIFYASWGNMIANVATLISRSGIRAGPDSALCQSQSFIVQM